LRAVGKLLKLERFFLRKRRKKDLPVRADPLDDGSILACHDETRKMEENVRQSFVADLLLQHRFDDRQLAGIDIF